MARFEIERLIVEIQLDRYSSKGSTENTLEEKIAEVDLNAYGYNPQRYFDLSGLLFPLLRLVGLTPGAESDLSARTFVTFAAHSRINRQGS